ncbi:DEAD/DEAH box RNA helicase [Achlya hypogyna]|uniref:ATP-dependent RNA helicase n=1 Tax=Achlya hypogyna TaxID=1202772 RepID=A0A1V9YXD7_ACHHY|nr:DEAD/DEAH box RNA helicase [Achlya hypogyna]
MITTLHRLTPRPAALARHRFHTLGLDPALVQALHAQDINTPSQVQREALPLVLDPARPNVVIGAETGSGKTLTYLLPLLQRLRTYPHSMHAVRKPIAVIMVPNQELVKQIERVVQSLDPDVPLACLTKTHAIPRRTPVLVGTPKAIMQHASPKDLVSVEMIVVDEADMLLGGGFERDTKQVLGTIRNQPLVDPSTNEYIPGYHRDSDSDAPEEALAPEHATIPTYGKLAVSEYLKRKFPDAVYAITDQFHRTLPTINQQFVHLKTQDPAERRELLLQILANDDAATGSVLIFVDSVASAKELEQFLLDNDVACRALHKEIPRDDRSGILEAMSTTRQVVVATDIAARGLDTRDVGHVIQYEFATNVVTHIHRIGRTARGGTTGKVTNIIGRENELVYKEIQAAGDDGTLTKGFSRRRSLRKKFKKASKPDTFY